MALNRPLLLAAAVASILAGQAMGKLRESDCAEVNYTTLQSHLTTTAEPARIGSNGLYALTPDECFYTPIGLASAFAAEHPDLYAFVVQVATESDAGGFEFLHSTSKNPQSPGSSRLSKRQRGCGNSCDGASCDSCTCKWDRTWCLPSPGPNNCVLLYICK